MRKNPQLFSLHVFYQIFYVNVLISEIKVKWRKTIYLDMSDRKNKNKSISNPLLKVLLEGVYDEDCILSKLQARNLLQ